MFPSLLVQLSVVLDGIGGSLRLATLLRRHSRTQSKLSSMCSLLWHLPWGICISSCVCNMVISCLRSSHAAVLSPVCGFRRDPDISRFPLASKPYQFLAHINTMLARPLKKGLSLLYLSLSFVLGYLLSEAKRRTCWSFHSSPVLPKATKQLTLLTPYLPHTLCEHILAIPHPNGCIARQGTAKVSLLF
jgi:hypothetical protein